MAEPPDDTALLLALRRQNLWQRDKQLKLTTAADSTPLIPTRSAPTSQPPVKEENTLWNQLNKHTYLKKELESLYGSDAFKRVQDAYAPDSGQKNSRLIDKILVERKQAFEASRERQRDKMHALAIERHQLMQEHQEVREKAQMLAAEYPALTPLAAGTPSIPSPHGEQQWGVDRFIAQTRHRIPVYEENCAKYRALYESRYKRLVKPYAGELGPQSYEPWQMADYYMVRSVVEEEVEKFLTTYFQPVVPAVDVHTQHALMCQEDRQWQRWSKSFVENRAIQLIMEALILEVTGDLSDEVAEECLELWRVIQARTNNLILQTVEHVATGDELGRLEGSAEYTMNTQTLYKLQQEQRKHRWDIWSHSQPLTYIGPEEIEEEAEEEDVTMLHFFDLTARESWHNQATAADGAEEKLVKQWLVHYQNMEAAFWKKLAIDLTYISVPKKASGVTFMRFSQNQKLVALGTGHGDILVYDVKPSTWQPLRLIHNEALGDDGVIDLAWSRDGAFFMTLSQMGLLGVWSLSGGGEGVVRTHLKAMEIPYNTKGFNPGLPTALLSMDVDEEDFLFKKGPLSTHGSQDKQKLYSPSLALFHPSYTLLGSQLTFCVALENGDIERCNLDLATQPAVPTEGEDDERGGNISILNPELRPPKVNLLGRGIEAHLLRRHKYPIVQMAFIADSTDLVTVDNRGYIFTWKYRIQDLNDFHWFDPAHKHRLNFSKLMYAPVTTAKPTVVFNEQSLTGGRQQKTRQDINQMRNDALSQLQELRLGTPWHQELLPDQQLMLEIYKSVGQVAEAGSLFHLVTKHATNQQLASYVTRLYKPIKVKSTKFMSCLLNATSTEIIFLLLFLASPPKGPHITVITLDLREMELKDNRLDVTLTDVQYVACRNGNLAAELSRSFGVTGSQYLFLNLSGSFVALSMASGQVVLKVEDPKTAKTSGFAGRSISTKALSIVPDADIALGSSYNKLFVCFYASQQKKKKNQNKITVLTFTDPNTPSQRQATWHACQGWHERCGLTDHKVSRQQRFDYMAFDLPGDEHPLFGMRTIILECLDRAVQQVDGEFSPEFRQKLAEFDRVENYRELLT